MKKVSYNKLWKLLIDKNMRKQDLRIGSQITTGTLAKMGRGELIRQKDIDKICNFLNCKEEDIKENLALQISDLPLF